MPTLFTLFPEWGPRVGGRRWIIIGAWVVTAFLVVRGTVRQGQLLELIARGARRRRERVRTLTGARVIRALLTGPTDFPEHYEFRVHLPDPESGNLVALYEPENVEQGQEWEPGRGATGTAWTEGDLVLARGRSVSDGTYELTPEEQKQYAHLNVVCSLPIRDSVGEPIGILSASSETDDGHLATADGQRELEALAEMIGRVLIDVLGVGEVLA